MKTDILINSAPYENRIALVENGNLIEFHLERPSDKSLVGNIYRGRVVRVLPGMQAAFIDIGLERTGFLYVDDVHVSMADMERRVANQDNPCYQYAIAASNLGLNHTSDLSAPHIENLLKEGQDILVQISKEPIGSKGARLTCHITLPCRNLVFMPLTDHIGVSRKIECEEIRENLKKKIESLRPEGTGFIVRTVAEHATSSEMEADMEFLMLLWDDVTSNATKASIPSLVYKDLDIILRSVRDLFTEDINELIVESKEVYDRLVSFVKTFAPELKNRILLHDREVPLFEFYGVEVEINRAMDKKVWLRSGGYIIIETTEALTVIDVNTGRYVGKNDLGETIFKTNMEAVKEIAYQLRLRNIGGIIIIDFIDMDNEQHREDLLLAFQEAMKTDKSRVNILKVSEFGLVQMTRKRSCENLLQMMSEPCFYCSGDGIIKSRRTICYEIFRKISKNANKIGGLNIAVKVHPKVADMLLTEEAPNLENLEKEINKRITVIPVPAIHLNRYEIVWNQ